MQTRLLSFHLIRVSALAIFAAILLGAAGQVNLVAWGTGHWLGEYSLKWGLGFFVFVIFCFLLFALALLAAYLPQKLQAASSVLVRLREKIGAFRWLLVIVLILAPIWFFQYTYWGVVFTASSFRLLIWFICTLLITYLLSRNSYLLTVPTFLTSLLLTGAALAAFLPLVNVTSYPFSLEWSEGNRLWDYSIMFGRNLYIYPADKPLVPFLDYGRQLIGGLPFLLPHITIAGERLWVALVAIIPYLLLGWAAFSVTGVKRSTIFLAGLWTFLFLRQGPIHAPLVISALIVALTWRRSLWISIPGVMFATWFVAVSRFTWMFAPGMWAGMLVLADASAMAEQASPSARSDVGRIAKPPRANPSARTWGRAVLLGAAGAVSGYVLPQVDFIHSGGVAEATANALFSQPLLWYRLLPNSTYDLGIVVNLLLAALPVIVVMILLVVRKDWPLSFWQGLAIILPLLAFLTVGLIASTKIGGGADLHNMDMFLIGTMFAASLAWPRLEIAFNKSPIMMAFVLLMAFLPSFFALRSMTPLLYAEELDRLKVLTGKEYIVRNDPNLLGFLPGDEKTERALNVIRTEVANASQQGEILFMDQRQLLTFGFISGIPLVPDYDKKYLMDRSMNNSLQPVFKAFYADLAAHRFALIVTDPLRKPLKGSDYSFGEENDAWVKWVAAPILCYYTVQSDLEDFRIQLLVPRDDPRACDLPQ